jgi:branched-chain amino acid transport system substrate-binding protein
MKMKTLAHACLAVATAAFSAGAAHAADSVKIGFITDMSGLYADIDGRAASRRSDGGRRLRRQGARQADRGRLRRPPEQGRHRRVEGARMDGRGGLDMLVGGTNSATALR